MYKHVKFICSYGNFLQKHIDYFMFSKTIFTHFHALKSLYYPKFKIGSFEDN